MTRKNAKYPDSYPLHKRAERIVDDWCAWYRVTTESDTNPVLFNRDQVQQIAEMAYDRGHTSGFLKRSAQVKAKGKKRGHR